MFHILWRNRTIQFIIVSWIIRGLYSLTQTQTLNNVTEETFVPVLCTELLHKKTIWIFMGETPPRKKCNKTSHKINKELSKSFQLTVNRH